MGWREDKARYEDSKAQTDAIQEEFMSSSMDLGGSRALNALGLFGGTTGEDKFPGTEPEDSWINEVDRLPINNKSFASFVTKGVRSMSRYDKFRNYSLEKKQDYFLRKIYEFRPSIFSQLGLV
jgi:hypothetical protein